MSFVGTCGVGQGIILESTQKLQRKERCGTYYVRKRKEAVVRKQNYGTYRNSTYDDK